MGRSDKVNGQTAHRTEQPETTKSGGDHARASELVRDEAMSPAVHPAHQADQPFQVRSGVPLPLGVWLFGNGANFAVFSRHATRLWLEFYDAPDGDHPVFRVELTPEHHRTGDIWHVWIGGVRPGQLYGYRAEGPYRPEEGHRFNPNRLLLDPYAAAITHLDQWDFSRAVSYGEAPHAEGTTAEERLQSMTDNAACTPKCVVTRAVEDHFDWQDDIRSYRSWQDTVIYETHVRGFTVHPSSGVTAPGTYKGLIEKIPYLLDLGVTTVELMPVQEFNEYEVTKVNPLTGERLRNYWGYNPTAFMAPNGYYADGGSTGQQKIEFKQMVKALHDAGLEVILDIVLNHTAEGNHRGPTFCWRGLDNAVYYVLEKDRRAYADYTGTGNTVRANHPIVRDYILDTLRYWVLEMHVDGFRFDLASVLGRDREGNLLVDPPLLERIAEDPILRNVKLIAEAWDAAGAYQVGHFARSRWGEWNGQFRDDVRRFWRGDAGMRGAFATRIAGSADLFKASGRGPEASINYITSHDGFTLNDLVSYSRKHNEANGEDNRDGTDYNCSDNYGIEGPTRDATIQRVRERQIKNFLLTLLVARGVPMLLGGDEFRRTQQGNNNAYCQDNEITWTDWALLDDHRHLHRFVREMITFRKQHEVLSRSAFYEPEDIHWIEASGKEPTWDDPLPRELGCLIMGRPGERDDILLLFNPLDEVCTFALPVPTQGAFWRCKADTARAAPNDILEDGQEERLDQQTHYTLTARSSVILVARA